MSVKNNPYRLDARESAFFKRELEYVKTKSYDTKYKKLKAFDLIPLSGEAPNGATEITYQKYSGIGFAKIIADYANDLPRVDVYGEEVTAKVRSIGSSYGYSIEEIRRSMMVGKNLDQRRASFAKRAIDQLLNSVAWTGDDDYDLQGLIDYPGITEYTVPNGAAGTATWVTKTPDEIVADLSGIVSAVIEATNGLEEPDTMIMPIAQYIYISNTRMTGSSDKTIMQFFLENNQFIKNIEWVTELNGAGATSTDRFMVYPKNPDNLTFEVPQMFEQFDPQQKGLEFEIPCHAKTGGVIVYYPLSVAFGDGI